MGVLNNMKKLILVAALVLGLSGISHADKGRKWIVTVVTGTYQQVFDNYGYVKSISLSTSTIVGSYVAGYSAMPSAAAGSANGFTGLFTATATVIAPIVYTGTSTVNAWNTGVGDDGAYIDSSLHMIQSNQANGGANNATVIWSK